MTTAPNVPPAPALLSQLRFGPDGLLPVVVQASGDGAVLLVGSMNAEALTRTVDSGRLWLWSRSRGRLWLKGETSGHFQQVDAIYVNCEQSSLLVRVTSQGPMCHTGHTTCFYRCVIPDRSLQADSNQAHVKPSLAATARRLYTIYQYLRDTDLLAESQTSRLLHAPNTGYLRARLADELRELAGVAGGTHRHRGLPDDVILEASQVWYWTLLSALAGQVPYAELRVAACLTSGPVPALSRAAERGTRLAGRISRGAGPVTPPDLRAVLRQVGRTCHAVGVAPAAPLRADLDQMRTRPYLARFFVAG